MPLTLNSIQGFSDLQNAVLVAEQPALGLHVAAIAGNAQFGMTRLEFFQGKYHNGDTVILPTSAIDRYNYSRDELIYMWAIQNSGSPDKFWLSGPDCLWYINHKVDQSTGAVFCEEWYRKSSVNSPDPAKSNDGILWVTTIAQRQLTHLTLSAQPTFEGDMSPSIGVDKPWQQCLAQKLNIGAKFSVVNTEIMYLGEFVNGQTVPTPISPADGYAYTYEECIFFPAWRWSTKGATYVAPDNSLGQLQRLQMSVSGRGVVSTRVDYKGDLDAVFQTVHGRIAVWALAVRGATLGGAAGVTTLLPSVLLNGWGSNGHVGSYEGGVDQGFFFGLDSGTTQPYANAGNAFDGDDSTAAVAFFQHTHKYAGCVWEFAAGPVGGTNVLSIESEVPFDGQQGLIVTNRTAGIWYSLDGGTTWIQIYNGRNKSRHVDTVNLAPTQDLSLVQVMAFTDSHDDMVHRVWDIKIINTP